MRIAAYATTAVYGIADPNQIPDRDGRVLGVRAPLPELATMTLVDGNATICFKRALP